MENYVDLKGSDIKILNIFSVHYVHLCYTLIQSVQQKLNWYRCSVAVELSVKQPVQLNVQNLNESVFTSAVVGLFHFVFDMITQSFYCCITGSSTISKWRNTHVKRWPREWRTPKTSSSPPIQRSIECSTCITTGTTNWRWVHMKFASTSLDKNSHYSPANRHAIHL